jgi:hypothetical protein
MVGDDVAFAKWYDEEIMRAFVPRDHALLSTEGRLAMIANGRNHARAYGIQSAAHQADFITHMWHLGPDFPRAEGFREVFLDAELDGAEKMARLHDGTITEAQAVAAAETTDVRFWSLTADGRPLTDG